jgi:hypothetical protein
MSRPPITIKVANNGNVTIVDVVGAGSNCQNATADLEKALGIVDEKSRETTASAYQDVDPIKLTA